ncbi:cadherin domain-containing protein [Ekhidna sp.]|uniref:cadherin domain-containing protein n=1 Tax=Ekhidna sp. TaxID=2608089 RepID=UPI003CCC08F3
MLKKVKLAFCILFYFSIAIYGVGQSAPTNIAIDNNSINENEPIGTLVGVFSASDPDGDASTFELVAGTGDTDNASFDIQNSNELVSTESFDHEVKSSYNIRVRVTDGTTNTYEEAFLVTIKNANEAPTGFNFGRLLVTEGNLPGAKLVDLTASDPDAGDTFRYELVDGEGSEDNDSFDITGDEIAGYDLVILETPDYETKSSYSIRLAVFDELGASYEEAFTVVVNNNQNTFSEWVSNGTIGGGYDRVYVSEVGPNDQFFVSGNVSGIVSLDENTTVEDEGFIAIYDDELNFSNLIRYSDLSNEYITVDEVFEIEFEDNGDIYLLASITSNGSYNTHIIKLNNDFEVKWRFDVSERFDGSTAQWRGNFSVDNGMIAFGRKIRGSAGRYYFGLVGSNGSNFSGPDFTNNQDQAYVALIDTAGVAEWIDFNLGSIQFSNYIADIEMHSGNMHVFYNYQNQYKLLVIDSDRNTLFEKTITQNSLDANYTQTQIAVNNSGDIYTTGVVRGINSDPGSVSIEGNVYTASVSEANYIVKYNADGVLQFVKFIDVVGSGLDFISYLDLVASSDGLYLYGTNSFNKITYESVEYDLGSDDSGFILKIAPDGSFSDIYDIGGSARMITAGMGLTAANEVVFTGYFGGGSIEIGGDTYTNDLYPQISDFDIYVGKLSSAMVASASKRVGNLGGEIIWRDASQTDDGLIYGFGDFVGEVQIGETTLYSDDRDLVIATFNADQTITDIQHIENNFNDEYAEQIEAFTYEEIGTGIMKKSFYLVGRGEAGKSLSFSGTDLLPNEGTFLVQLNENYLGLWSTSFGSVSNPQTTLDSNNEIYLSGTFSSSLDIEGTEVSNFIAQTNSILINYDASGTLGWYKAQIIQKNISVGKPAVIGDQVYLPINSIGVNAGTIAEGNINLALPNSSSTYFGALLAFDLDGNGLWGQLLNGESFSNYNLPMAYETPSGNIGFSMFNKYSEMDASGTLLISGENYGDLAYATFSKGVKDKLFVYGYNSQTFGSPTIVLYNNNYIPTLLNRHFEVSSSEILKTNNLFTNSTLDSLYIFGEYGLNLLTVNSAPESISLTTSDVEENLADGTFISKINVSDSDDDSGFEFDILFNNPYYSIRNDSLFANQLINYEEPNELHTNLTLRVIDPSGGKLSQLIEMNVVDVNDTPSSTFYIFDYADQRYYGPNGASVSGLQTRELLPIDSAITIFSTQDEDVNESFTYTLVTDSTGFEDYVYFKFNGDTLQVADTLDYEFIESRETVANEGYYSILVKVTDSGGAFIYKELRIGLINENEPSVGLQFKYSVFQNGTTKDYYDSLPENNFFDLQIRPIDPDSIGTLANDWPLFKYKLVEGAGDDDNLFVSMFDNRALRPSDTLNINFEKDSILNIRVGFYDADSSNYLEFPVELTVLDLDDPIEGLLLNGVSLSESTISLEENAPIGTTLGKVEVVDEDKKPAFNNYELGVFESTYSPYFEIDQDDSLVTVLEIDYEQLNSNINVTLEAINLNMNQSQTYNLSLDILNVNEAPEISTFTELPYVNENDPGFNLLNWNIFLSDPEANPLTMELVSGEGDDDNDSFEIPENASRPQPTVEFNHEEKDTVTIRVRVSDPEGLFDEEVIKIAIADRNDTPTNIILTGNEVLENLPANTLVGTFSAEDEDANDSHIFEFESGRESDFFTISGNQLLTSKELNYEAIDSHTIFVTTSDLAMQEVGAITNSYQFEIAVIDVEDGVQLSNTSIEENLEVGTEVGTLSIPGGSQSSFEFVSGGADNESFSIDGNRFLTAASFDFETKDVYSVSIQAAGDGGTVSMIEVRVTDANDAPTGITISSDEVTENLDAGTVVGVLGAEDQDEQDTFTFTVEETSDFEVSDGQLLTSRSFDFFTEDPLTATITVEDGDGASFTQALTITILNDPSDDDEEILNTSDVVEIKIYPNPTTGYLTIGTEKSIEVKIFGLSGKMHLSKILERNGSLDVSKLPQGQYIIQLHDSGKLITSEKIIKIN